MSHVPPPSWVGAPAPYHDPSRRAPPGRFPKRRRLLVVGAGVAVIVAAGAWGVLTLHPLGIGGGRVGPELTIPPAIAGESRDPGFDSVFESQESTLVDQLTSDGASSTALGWYGQGNGTPAHLVVAASGPVRGGSPEELVRGLPPSIVGELGSRTTITRGAEPYACYLLTGALNLGMCAWIDPDFVGAAICIRDTDLGRCATFAAAARTAVRA